MTDFRDTLRAELVAAAARPVPSRTLLPVRPVLLRGGLLAAAAAAAALVIFVLPWGAERAPEPAQRTTALPGRPLFGGSLEAGVRYRTRALVPPISLRADGSQWFVYDATSPTTLVLQRREGVAGQVTGEKQPQRFLMFFTLGSVTDPGTGDILPAPDDLVGWMRSNPNLGVTEVTRTRLYGRPATRVTFHIPRRPALVEPNCPFGKVTVDTEPPNVAECAAIGPSVTAPVGSSGYLIVPDGAEPLIAGELALVPSEVGQIERESKPVVDSVLIGR
jgi:hypothetical protein